MARPSLKPVSSTHVHVAGEVCPWCEQPIPEDQSEKIRAHIKKREERQKAEQETRLRQEFERKEADAQKRFEAEKATTAEKARKEVAQESAKAIEQLKKEAAERETTIRAEAAQSVREKMEKQLEAAKEATVKAKSAATEAEAELKDAKENQEAQITKRVAEVREALENDKSVAVNAVRSEMFNEKLKWQEKVTNLQRQLEKKTSDELGEGAEIVLLDQLKGAFKDDLIQHVGKGKAGADIIHDIIVNGKECGRIIHDSKNRSSWRNDYVSKLRDDQIAAKAEHAILSSNKFPAGAKQLHEQDGIIIASPARVLTLVQLLRRSVIQMHTLSLSNQQRDEKTADLYDFIRSDACRQLFERIDEHTDDLLELQAKEIRQHEATWQQQGKLVRAIQKSSGNLTSAIDRIIGTAE